MWVETGFPPSTFWEQTERSFSNVLAGAAKARVTLAWQIGAMTGTAYAGKLKSLSEYLAMIEPEEVSGNAALLHALKRLQAKGVPMDIKKLH